MGRKMKAQSAMEYLMTYGWAILIIAVVLAALFQLGVFNTGALAPRAPPGTCQVYRPNGPASTSLVNLEGICNGELPQYVGVFNGASSYINVGSPAIPTSQGFSIAGWVNINTWSNYPDIISKTDSNLADPFDDYVISDGSMVFLVGPGTAFVSLSTAAGTALLNTWQFWTFVYSGGSSPTISIYSNGVLMAGPSAVSIPVTDSAYNMLIGSRNDFATHMSGSMSNIQIYNASLSGPEVNALYVEGIGGSPIRLQNLVGWWPLNGNANDYSGNNNNGVPSGVSYTSQWTSGYTPP